MVRPRRHPSEGNLRGAFGEAAGQSALNLKHRYLAIVIAGPTMSLLADDATLCAAQVKIRAQLADGGTAPVPLAHA